MTTRRNFLRILGGTATGAGIWSTARASTVSGDWSMARVDARNSGYNPNGKAPTGFLFDTEAFNLRRRWRVKTGGFVGSAPVVVDGIVYVVSDDSRVYALDAKTGAEKWAFDTGNRIEDSPAVVNETLYLGSRDGLFYAIDIADGRLKWKYDVGEEIYTAITIADDFAYFGTNNHLHAIRLSEGVQTWSFSASLSSTPSVAENSNIVTITANSNEVLALDSETGNKLWRFETELKPYLRTPVIRGNRLFVSASDNLNSHVHSLGLNDGREWWRSEFGLRNASTPTIADGTVYVSCRGGYKLNHNRRLFALWSNDGAEKWHYDGYGLRHPVVVGDTVIGGSTHTFHGVDAERGTRRWKAELDRRSDPGDVINISSPPAIVDNTIYAGGSDGSIYAFESQPLPWKLLGGGALGVGVVAAVRGIFINSKEGDNDSSDSLSE